MHSPMFFRLLLAVVYVVSLLCLSACSSDGDNPADSDSQSDHESDSEDDSQSDGESDSESEDSESGEPCVLEGAAGEATTDSYGVVWVPLPSGCFKMGCVPQDTRCGDSEKPRHRVTLGAFEITQTEITQDQYEGVIGSDPGTNYSESCNGDCPVVDVSWFDAKAFCEAIGGRLPTEAEWEYAARAGSETIYICGDDANCLKDAAWYYDTTNGYGMRPVKGKQANGFGLYDMTGNAEEWCADWYGENYYTADAVDNPTGPDAGASGRVTRGQHMADEVCRVSSRYGCAPENKGWEYGIRCVRVAK